ncbi:benzoate-CoA ligase family protein [Aquibacillus sp. 3ASR75-11]|uniref:Benzoate-CoA ligase family protein n=1 Tax=Terrihalobacillus insolitus TaxID=2950438 RepID=A0A9X3WQS1_9BACI|nr:benzoate-CoA ligase family protein [Terrihalobacillus insolitus]MDC3413981.1 benzoate-CoA ligase family protein [Terrihalobacillus insolitus]MDC3424070.1 benzoate-CoA ligase family protein [Terrihalobacillus insolitus]
MSDHFNPVSGIDSPYNAALRFIDRNIEKGYGEKTAIYFENKQISYAELNKEVNQFAQALSDINVEHENRVMLLMHDSPEFIISFFGSVKIGAIPVPLNTLGTAKDYVYYLNHSRAKVLVVNDDLWENIKDFRSEFAYLRHVIVVSDHNYSYDNVIHFKDFVKGKSEYVKTFYSTVDDAAFWLYTSGSTGKPKGAIHLQKSMEHALSNFAKKVLRMTEDDVTLSASKLFFAYGLGNGMYFPLGVGASTVLMKDKPTPEKVFEAIERYKPTIFFGVPTLYGSMLDYVERSEKKYDLSSIRVCVSAGEKLPSHYFKKWKEKFSINILDGIGSTEVLHIYLSNTLENFKPGSTGKVVPGYEAKIVNEKFEPVESNEVGDLLIKGDSITAGYWSNSVQNKMKLNGEWLHTGDKYYKDEDGYYWYVGRSDDMLNVGGILVSPIEIESALIDHTDVLEVAVQGNENEKGLEKPKAYVVLKEGVVGNSDKEAELIQYVRGKLAKHKYPREITFMESLPKTTTGKIQRFKLKQSLTDTNNV